ncbi:glycerophosphodiester phosphodiesterase family protein [Proteus vulgaris]|uniref:glycerophosphodiester phosphodiesterase family protein n=1 Tax=Proteus vulgaris TaxID=585 RepID=UPI0018CF7431|nr:glycerophosphodiester phosphodiesterase family protein [Proteus vulgaris]QPN89171.1 hypothetical protein IM703_15480 [Proteus vulgaris]
MSTIPTQNQVPSEAASDLKYNSGKVDEFITSNNHFYVDRFGKKHYTIEGINYLSKQAMLNYGYITKRSFESGNTIINPNDVLLWESNGEYYRWDGKLPKVVSAGSTPELAGGIGDGKWKGVGDATLRTELASNKGASIIKTNNENTVQHELELSKESVKETKNVQRMQIPISDRRLIINAHRGYSETYFEQTLLAFSQCRADAIEIDMQTTSDGVAVCFHDDDLSIQTTGSGAIKDNTIQQIRTYRYKRAQNTRYADMLSIPSLSAVCRVAARTGKKLLAEIKGYRTIDDCAQYNSIISTYGLASTTTFISFDFQVLQYLHNINPLASYGLILASYNEGMDENINELISWGGGVIAPSRNIISAIGIEKLRQWEANGLTVNSWTIYTAEQLNEVLSYGIRHLTLDKDFADILNK